jgi:protein-S-isoprenylcysteine O-methyltransferase Ste14
LANVLLTGGIAITTWAEAVNPFFEPGVRIQKERAQQVIMSGPYKFVRHPDYAAAISMFIGIPFALASWWALPPAALAITLLVVRTRWEDRFLYAGLFGYGEYAPVALSAPPKPLVTKPVIHSLLRAGAFHVVLLSQRTQ